MKLQHLFPTSLPEGMQLPATVAAEFPGEGAPTIQFAFPSPLNAEPVRVPPPFEHWTYHRIHKAFWMDGVSLDILIDVMLMPRELSAAQWCAWLLHLESAELLNCLAWEEKAGPNIEVLFKTNSTAYPVVSRARVFKDGPTAYYVRIGVGEPFYHQHATTLLSLLRSFSYLPTSNLLLAENMLDWKLEVGTGELLSILRFQFPASWNPSPSPVSIPEMTMSVLDDPSSGAQIFLGILLRTAASVGKNIPSFILSSLPEKTFSGKVRTSSGASVTAESLNFTGLKYALYRVKAPLEGDNKETGSLWIQPHPTGWHFVCATHSPSENLLHAMACKRAVELIVQSSSLGRS